MLVTVPHKRPRTPQYSDPKNTLSMLITGYTSKYGSSNNASIDVPATAEVGNILFALVGSNYSNNAPPSGWGTLTKTTETWHNYAIFYKTCVVGDIGATVTAAMSGSEPYNSACLSVKMGSEIVYRGYASKQTSSDVANLTTTTIYNIDNGYYFICGGSARVGSKTLTFDYGSAILTRSGDASLSSTVWFGTTIGSSFYNTLRTPSNAKLANGIIVLGKK